ncbi:uncharacterized protein LOC106870943 [Argonauta hians]
MISDENLVSTVNSSNEAALSTSTDQELIVPEKFTLKAEEIVFVSLVVIVWIVSVVVFIRKWDNIRILEPVEPRYRHAPKNLESIRIVKRPQDSVIYKNYGRKMSITMLEREKKRLERMNTLPTIEMEEISTEI